jgi:phage tail-like protein
MTQSSAGEIPRDTIVSIRSLVSAIRRLFMQPYPLPRNHCQVDWGGSRIAFCEVSGLSMAVEAPAFRDGTAAGNHDVTMPGLLRFPHRALRRAVQQHGNDFYDWINTIELNTMERRDITVAALGADNAPVMVWKFRNAFPVRLECSPLEADNDAPLMETLAIAHERMTVDNP